MYTVDHILWFVIPHLLNYASPGEITSTVVAPLLLMETMKTGRMEGRELGEKDKREGRY